jgi:hypothetical protein
LLGTHPPAAVLWGIEPGSTDWTTGLSTPAARSLDALVDAVADELQAWDAILTDERLQ